MKTILVFVILCAATSSYASDDCYDSGIEGRYVTCDPKEVEDERALDEYVEKIQNDPSAYGKDSNEDELNRAMDEWIEEQN